MPSLYPRSPRARIVTALLLAGGSGAALIRLSRFLRAVRKEQASLAAAAVGNGAANAVPDAVGKRQPGVDSRFVQRLISILRVCIPGPLSREALIILLQSILLISRTLISDHISALEGKCADNVTAQNWVGFRQCVIGFATAAVPASLVNSALKAAQLNISLALRKRLTGFLHQMYMGNRAYYAASVLGGLSHADQRITDDVEKFCETLAELHSRTLKPLFDLIIFSRSLGRIIGYRGQFFLYSYFVVIGGFLRRISPPLAKLTAQYSSLNAAFRTAHHHIASNAEEVAFNDPPSGRAEMISLNSRLNAMITHSRLTAVQRFLQQCLDGYLVKYTASIIGLTIFAAPLYYAPTPRKTATNVLAGHYVNSMRLMMQASAAMGELVLVYKRIHTLAGHTARVAELIEQVRELGRPKGHLEAFRRIQERNLINSISSNAAVNKESLLKDPAAAKNSISDLAAIAPANRASGPSIKLENVSMWSPEGTLLVRDLSVEVPQGTSIIILGPNGSGKSSILRMLAGLWPLQAGTVTTPPRDTVFFLSQTPYMFTGSLAEQLMYPNLPGVVVGENVKFDINLASRCLENVELEGLISRCGGFDGALAWDDTLSGGERNRLAVARLLYHKPKFAILDECTAAVSADGEVVLYRAMAEAGITLLSVAHRKAVMKFHQAAIVLDGDTSWGYRPLEKVDAEDKPKAQEETRTSAEP